MDALRFGNCSCFVSLLCLGPPHEFSPPLSLPEDHPLKKKKISVLGSYALQVPSARLSTRERSYWSLPHWVVDTGTLLSFAFRTHLTSWPRKHLWMYFCLMEGA
jgi:hypothetical protein